MSQTKPFAFHGLWGPFVHESVCLNKRINLLDARRLLFFIYAQFLIALAVYMYIKKSAGVFSSSTFYA